MVVMDTTHLDDSQFNRLKNTVIYGTLYISVTKISPVMYSIVYTRIATIDIK